jgi:predicted nucleic acid-binding protein
MYIIDSSVWVSLFLDFDINHNESLEIFENILNSKIILPYCVINEVSSVLTYK